MQASSCSYIPTDTHQPNLPLIYGHQVSCSFTGKHTIKAVDQVTFGIEEGKITAIIGESGSGKSTLLKLIYGLLEPEEGEVRYRGWQVPTRKDKLIPGHDAMKLVSQGFDDLNTYANVWDNVASQLSNTNLKRKEERTQSILQKLRIDHLAKQRVADLSGGEKQRVAICRALINDPEVLLMDEPFNQVDASFRDTLQQDIKSIVAETGLTIILVSHDPTEVLALAEELIVMKAGKIVDQGTPQKLYHQPSHAYTAQLLAKSNILSPTQAALFNIQASQQIIVHQEWVQVQEAASPSSMSILDIRFRGFYNELVIGNQDIQIHAIDFRLQFLNKGEAVDISIQKYYELSIS